MLRLRSPKLDKSSASKEINEYDNSNQEKYYRGIRSEYVWKGTASLGCKEGTTKEAEVAFEQRFEQHRGAKPLSLFRHFKFLHLVPQHMFAPGHDVWPCTFGEMPGEPAQWAVEVLLKTVSYTRKARHNFTVTLPSKLN